MTEFIKIRGAKQHNLKNISADIPKNQLVVFTGISGSGKSSLAFDTIYAEGQRRYVESLSSYARQFLGIMDKPDVESIEGLSPAISIDQKSTSHNPRSTVGTVTEIYDYLRLLFARIGHPHCPNCGREIERQTSSAIVEKIIDMVKNGNKTRQNRFLILSPVVRDRKGEFRDLFNSLKSKGFTRVRIDGKIFDLKEELVLIKTNKHTIDVVVDRLTMEAKTLRDTQKLKELTTRITDAIEQSLSLSEGLVLVSEVEDKSFDFPKFPQNLKDHLFSQRFSCPVCNISIPEIEPRAFSFNSPHGACPTCSGIGTLLKVDPELIINKRLSLTEGGILPFGNSFENDTWFSRTILTVARIYGIDPKAPIGNYTDKQLQVLLYGTGDEIHEVEGNNRFGRKVTIYEEFKGVVAELERRYRETESEYVRAEIEKYQRQERCPTCNGKRLKKDVLGITIVDKSIIDITALSIDKAKDWILSLKNAGLLTSRELAIGNLIIKEISTRLEFLLSVGLDYLTLDRTATTLAGGEAQRIRLASQIGSGLSGVLYVLDEPSIGLHPKDNTKLINTLKHLKKLGNTVIVVEHDKEMMLEADYILDFGPGAGDHGGKIIADGAPAALMKNENSITGKYLSGKKKVTSLPNLTNLTNLPNSQSVLSLIGASQNNLKNINVQFPLGKLVCITGVSGSGKSTLVVETLYHAIAGSLNPFHKEKAGKLQKLEGIENIRRVILIDQSPIGRTPRSNPATYTGIFSYVRDLFSRTPEAKLRGYLPGRFSFNVRGGRCEACEGEGEVKIEMQFLPDVYVECEVCRGKRYNNETLEVHYKNKNIAEVLSSTVEESLSFFANIPGLYDKVLTLNQVGLSYIKLGQPAPTLSGGEAQRVKLATELSKRSRSSTLYILDEPTTGLHFADLEKLLHVLKQLVALGNTVIVIEHNIDIIKNSDWIIDLGPEGGDKGGEIIAQGTVHDIIKSKASYTGKYLQAV